MIENLKNHLNQNLPFLKGKKLLLAVSGGLDSMVLTHLFKQLDYNICIAHCNFNLRGEESNEDESFIKDYAAKENLKIFTTRFDTALFAADNKVSIQVAARRLRYVWFSQLLQENSLDYLLTAHHLDDSLETFLINFTRGTGLEGLTGIPQQNDNVIRPLLPFTRSELEVYANKNTIQWREDSSNASNKYLRNKLRHDVVPVLKSLNGSFMDSFADTLQHLQQAQSLVADASILIYRQVVAEKDNQKLINIAELKRLANFKAYLYQWLSPLGFTAWEDIYALLEAQSGKQVLSASSSFKIYKNRDSLIVAPLANALNMVFEIQEGQYEINEPIKLTFEPVNKKLKTCSSSIIYVDAQKLKFPLFVRRWEEGDTFQPLGMNGNKKKVSKYFKDEKMSLSDKEDTWLLLSDNQIVWVVGKRADERFKTEQTTTQIIKIEVI
jgi:tRNA(Ile)-lysidine synthase